MPKIVKPLSATQVRQAKPKPRDNPREYNLAGGKGLYLRVKPSGTKLWLFNYQKPYTKQRSNISIGTYPEVSLADAEAERNNFRSLLAQDIDPREHRSEEEQKEADAYSNTLNSVAKQWLKVKEDDLSEIYLLKISNGLNKYILPKLGKMPVHKITPQKAIKVITPVAAAGKMETVKKLCRWLNEIMVFAANTGFIQANPLSGIRKGFKDKMSENFQTIDPDELPEFMTTLEAASIKLITKLLIEWQLHTMIRPAEAAGTRWQEIDFDKRLWEIPHWRMKGRKNPRKKKTHVSHFVPLSNQAIKILETMKPISGNRTNAEYVFPSDIDPRKPRNSQSANMAIKRMGFKGRLHSHGLRHLASTILNEKEFNPAIVEVALAHLDASSIKGTYDHAQYLEQRRAMMHWWSDHIEEAATGKKPVASKKHLKVIQA
ncbi:MAG: tyrosine-type recombinase/integrase [Proteobacteria bacterium]|nr:tyrosine-type recombinase/integrase [Pseudomonadota bacterium]